MIGRPHERLHAFSDALSQREVEREDMGMGVIGRVRGWVQAATAKISGTPATMSASRGASKDKSAKGASAKTSSAKKAAGKKVGPSAAKPARGGTAKGASKRKG